MTHEPALVAHAEVGPPSCPARRSLGFAVRMLREPMLGWHVVRAQLCLRSVAAVPPSVRLNGRVRAGDGGRIAIGDRMRLTGTIVPIEPVAWPDGMLDISTGSLLTYGTSISEHAGASIGRSYRSDQLCLANTREYRHTDDTVGTPPSQPVVVGERIRLGAPVIVLPGVHIGDDAVGGAGSVVARDIPPRTVAVGQPARVVRRF